ncbi:MAG TPA: alpha/beta hydrolase [Candidatus Deferrimicrobiaceae bacterium]|nr:alpha/beta hydrolase [Candidatus Deferrimicrobiaceae bacterium]
MPEVTVQGEIVRFEDSVKTSRHAIVFLHGAGGSHHTFRDQWAGLKGGVRMVIPDLPGHGLSGGSPRESVDACAAWLVDFLGEIRLDRFILAGHSMGGAIALQAGLGRLKGLEALVLLGTGARLRISPVIFEGIGERFMEFAPELVGWMTSAASSALLRDDITKDVISTRPAAFLADFHACNGFDVMDRLGEIRVPTLVVNGDDDRLTPLKYGEYLAANIPGAVLKIIRGAGHLVMLEKPNEVNAVITSFVHSLEG